MTTKMNDDGVSVIIGTLLLILITVVAASALAMMVSEMQKEAMDRQTHITSVQDELLQINGVTFETSPFKWDNSTDFSIYNPPALFNQSLFNQGASNQSFTSVTFTLTNLNNQDSLITGIAVNDVYAHNATVISTQSQPNSQPLSVSYNFSSQYPSPDTIVVPASSSEKIQINFTTDFSSLPANIMPGDQVTIKIMTSLTNMFEKSFQPPNPVIVPSTVTQNLGSISRDALVLDGSQSFSPDNQSIVAWNWDILDANSTYSNGVIDQQGNCTDSQNLTMTNLKGKIAQFQPESQGPFCVNLTVQDSSGMEKSSDYVEIPEDNLFVPPASMNLNWIPWQTTNGTTILSYPYYCSLNVTILNTNKIGVPNQPVNYVVQNYPDNLNFGMSLFPSNANGMTDQYGNVTYIVSGNGTVEITSNKIQRSFSFTGNTCPLP